MTASNFVQLSSLGAGVAQFSTGAVSAHKAGTIYVHGTTTPVILYTDETASTVLSSDGTFTTDTLGRIPGWVALGLEVDITVPPAAPVAAYTGGPPGPPAVPRGPWVNGSTYAKGEIVTFAGLPYASLVDGNFNLQPDQHAAQWLLLIALPPSLLTTDSAVGGDLSGALPNPTVSTWGGQTKAQVLAGQTLGGDLTGAVGAATVSTWGAQTKAQVVQAQAVGGELTGTVGSATVNAWGGQTKAQVVAGNAPKTHQASHAPGGTDVLSGLTDINFAVANKDGAPGTPSLRTLGTGSQQAVAGDDSRLLNTIWQTGDLKMSALLAAPTGWLLCDGSAISRTGSFAALFSAIGTTYGVGDGSTTFNVPDLRGRVPVGVGTGAGLTARSRGQTGGEETHLLATSEIPSHTHGVNDPGHTHTINDPGHAHAYGGNVAVKTGGRTWGTIGPLSGGGASWYALDAADFWTNSTTDNVASTGISSASRTTGLAVNAAGGGGGHNNMPPYGVVNYFIKT